MKAPVKQAAFDPVPAGNHVARLYQLIHIGTVEDTYMGEAKLTDKVRLSFELCHEKKEFKEGEGEKPMSISREVTFSMGEKATLRAFVEGMVGKLSDDEAAEFELESLLGKACMVFVVHEVGKDRTYAKIKSITPLPKGTEAPAQVNESKLIDVNDLTEDEFLKLPDWLQEKIGSSKEWKDRTGSDIEEVEDDINPEDVPF